MTWWLTAFNVCHCVAQGEVNLTAWPDGGCFLDQEYHVLEMFLLIEDELMRAKKRSENTLRAKRV